MNHLLSNSSSRRPPPSGRYEADYKTSPHHQLEWEKKVFFSSFPSFCNYPFVTDFAIKLKQTGSAKSIIPLHYWSLKIEGNVFLLVFFSFLTAINYYMHLPSISPRLLDEAAACFTTCITANLRQLWWHFNDYNPCGFCFFPLYKSLLCIPLF